MFARTGGSSGGSNWKRARRAAAGLLLWALVAPAAAAAPPPAAPSQRPELLRAERSCTPSFCARPASGRLSTLASLAASLAGVVVAGRRRALVS